MGVSLAGGFAGVLTTGYRGFSGLPLALSHNRATERAAIFIWQGVTVIIVSCPFGQFDCN